MKCCNTFSNKDYRHKLPILCSKGFNKHQFGFNIFMMAALWSSYRATKTYPKSEWSFPPLATIRSNHFPSRRFLFFHFFAIIVLCMRIYFHKGLNLSHDWALRSSNTGPHPIIHIHIIHSKIIPDLLVFSSLPLFVGKCFPSRNAAVFNFNGKYLWKIQ